MITNKLNSLKKTQKSIILALIIFLFLLAVWIGFKLYGYQLINAMYEGRSIGILNRIIEHRDIHPVEFYLKKADRFFSMFFAIVFLIPFLIIFLRPAHILSWSQKWKRLETHTDDIDAIPDSQIAFWIVLAAGLSLYMELMIIRLHSSFFQLFAFFKNVSLLSCFLGLGIGYARGSKRPLATPLVLPFLALQIVFMYLLRFSSLADYLQNPISEQLSLALNQMEDIGHTLLVYAFLTLFFAFNVLCFIPLGHLTSRLMMRKEKLASYSWNLIGSIAGILLFSFISFTWAPPIAWIVIAAMGLIVFFNRDTIGLLPSVISVIILVVLLSIPFYVNRFDVYSPYQIVTLYLTKHMSPRLKVNNTFSQNILNLSEKNISLNKSGPDSVEEWANIYNLPFLFKPKPKNVLIIGTGTGNDVAAAIRGGSEKIDAVEIDPIIVYFGKMLHPEAPYQSSNVNVIVNDARTFIRNIDKKYDLIVYGLLDAYSLLSGKGGIRLDSYIYTVEAFQECRKKLKEGGIMGISLPVAAPIIGQKLFLMLQEAFDGQSPIVYCGRSAYSTYCTFMVGEGLKKSTSVFQTSSKEMTAMFTNTNAKFRVDKSTDDWPFFYMPVKKFPLSYVVMLMILMVVSITLIRQLVSGSGGGFSIPCFFLGAGFMLVETKGITELALVYGSTWIVVSVVILFILIMAFLANLLVIRRGNPAPLITYGLLFISVFAGLGLTLTNLNSVTPWLSRIIMPIVLTIPLFFSGFAFSAELKKSDSVATALYSNLLGSMLGGFLEYNSMVFGFRSLYIFAFIMYGFAFWGSMRTNK